MPLRDRLSSPRFWTLAWLALLAAVWARGMAGVYLMRDWVRASHTMCAGLPAYGEIAGHLPAGAAPVGFVTDAGEMAGAERFFCAQYQLAPHVLARWGSGGLDLERRDLTAGAVIVHIGEPAEREARLGALAAAAERRGTRLERLEMPGGLWLAKLSRP